ncbi:hypothetical protein BX666DRAFT_1928758 [Dichotomocladium elegans]|nr:hypothetical protein BX666DRAFT_1928758 [Dichotomocladium elegans]
MAKEGKKRKSKSEDEHKKHKKIKSSKEGQITPPKVDIISTTRPAKHASSQATPHSSFSEIVAKLYVHLAPMWAANVMEGVTEQLNAFLMKHVPQLDGIVLAHANAELITKEGRILYDSPFCHFFVRVKFLVWKPKKGAKLIGRINLQSQDHIGLLIFGTFNASIPRARIPDDKYEWRPSEDKVPVQAAREDAVDGDDDNALGTPDDEEEAETEVAPTTDRSQYGEWVDKSTGMAVGGEDGSVEFTVVDIIEANDILTVGGSL